MRRLWLVLAVLVATVGCGDGDDGDVNTRLDSGSRGSEAPQIDCGGSVFDFERLTDAPSIESLAEGPANAVDDAGAPAFDPTQSWRVVNQTEERVDLVRELDEPIDNGSGDVRTHESRTLAQVIGANNVPEGSWLLVQAGPCVPRLILDTDLEPADLSLAAEPAATATSIELLVHERACASGQSAEGRIEVVDLEETGDQVRLRIGVRPRDGGQDCQGNPPTPFAVELSEPLGAREIVDASIVPPRAITTE